MDINITHEPFDEVPYGIVLDISKSHYAIYSCWNLVYNQENIAFAIMTPSSSHSGGALRIFSHLGEAAQGYIADPKKLIRRYKCFRSMIEKDKNGKLIWEGKINGLTKQEICQYESPWLN